MNKQFRGHLSVIPQASGLLVPRITAALVTMVGLLGSALAAVPAAVSTALTDLQADALTVAGIVLAAIVAVYAFKFIRKGL